MHSGDYKFDHTPIDGRVTDVNKLAQLGQEGVLALLADSTNVESEGSTGSESQVGQAFHRIFADSDGRVLVACFSSHIHRIQQAVQIGYLHGRKFAVSGRSMVKNVNIARNLGYLKVPDDAQIKLTEIDNYPADQVLILTTGSQGEPLSALSRMAWDDHPQVELRPGDTVVISARPVPGNEISVMDTVNRLMRSGAKVIYGNTQRGARVGPRLARGPAHAAQPAEPALLRARARRVPPPVPAPRAGPRGRHPRREHLHPRQRRRARAHRRPRPRSPARCRPA